MYDQHDYQRQHDPERQADNEAIDATAGGVHGFTTAFLAGLYSYCTAILHLSHILYLRNPWGPFHSTKEYTSVVFPHLEHLIMAILSWPIT